MGMSCFNATNWHVVPVWAALVAVGIFSSAQLEAAGGHHSNATAKATGVHNAPIAPGRTQLVVYKSARRIALYESGSFRKEFPLVLGLQPQGRKRHASDARTPEGLYHVVAKRRHARWQMFLAIDYPNASDRHAYEHELAEGKIPDDAGKPFAIGGDVGIHGNDREDEQARGIDWTKGCIALAKPDITELAGHVRVGTPVWIVE
jgi:murein L,D-transpeptidase YafK